MILTSTHPGYCQPQTTVPPPGWLAWVHACCEKYGVEPAFALAVAEVESSTKGVRFRFGKMGKGTYYGAFGIHKSFLSKWAIDNPYVNAEVGIRALARYKDKRRALRKYNASFNEPYYRRILTLERRNREEMRYARTSKVEGP